MKYINAVITPNEKLIVFAKTHGFIYTRPVLWALCSLVCLSILYYFDWMNLWYLALAPLLPALYTFIHAWVYSYSTELAVTDKRVIAKFGFIRRQTIELKHSKVESLQVNQGIMGRIFNFGSIKIIGSGGTTAPIPYISDPLKFRSAALTQEEKHEAKEQ